MNDFTIEELRQLKRSVTYHWNEVGEYATDEKRKEFILIKQKLESLIDNYCEHDFYPCLSPLNIETCHKCMRVK